MGDALYKAKGGIIRVSLEGTGVIKRIKITGDFFIFPEDSIESLENALVGIGTDEEELLKVVKDFYENIEAHGIGPEDIVKAIKKAL